MRDLLSECLCVVSGKTIEIAPYQPPLYHFGTFDHAKRRIFMSATTADDSFLVRGLGVAEDAVDKPLRYAAERWSGEKMLLIPMLIDEELSDGEIVHAFAAPDQHRNHGVVVICPSFPRADWWQNEGADVAKPETIDAQVARLRNGDRCSTLAVANRYDGIDLPDDTCRVLILDSLPRPLSLIDLYMASVREGSDIVVQRTARAIEQGLGRAVRGEKDFCVVLLIGPDLVKFVRTQAGQRFLSAQTRLQINIGFDIAEMARDEIARGKVPLDALKQLIQQSLRRDEAWKEFYTQQMDTLTDPAAPAKNLAIYAAERHAATQYHNQNVDGSVKTLQGLIDGASTAADRGWYLQEMALPVFD